MTGRVVLGSGCSRWKGPAMDPKAVPVQWRKRQFLVQRIGSLVYVDAQPLGSYPQELQQIVQERLKNRKSTR